MWYMIKFMTVIITIMAWNVTDTKSDSCVYTHMKHAVLCRNDFMILFIAWQDSNSWLTYTANFSVCPSQYTVFYLLLGFYSGLLRVYSNLPAFRTIWGAQCNVAECSCFISARLQFSLAVILQ